MSKEEILENYEYDVHYYGGGRRHILTAMDEYAKQEAIGFWGWVGECDFTFQRAGIHIFIENNPHGIKSGYYTVDQLYSIYQQQKEGK